MATSMLDINEAIAARLRLICEAMLILSSTCLAVLDEFSTMPTLRHQNVAPQAIYDPHFTKG